MATRFILRRLIEGYVLIIEVDTFIFKKVSSFIELLKPNAL
ncbi:DUF3898 domain-containing protein [Bacillus mycoides]